MFFPDDSWLNDSDTRTALHMASENGHDGIVRELLAAKCDVNAVCTKKGEVRKSAFQLAKISSTQLVFRILISDRPPSDLSKIMIGAIKHDDFGLLEMLVQGGANINCTDDDGNTPLSMASELGRVNAVALLLQNGTDTRL